MPYRSEAQRRFLHARHPEIAARWDREHPNQGKLPKHVHKAMKRRLHKRKKKT